MKIFVCTDHDYYYPVGVASVVLAESEAEATMLLNAALIDQGLRPATHEGGPYTLHEITGPTAVVLCNGDY